MAPVKPTIKPSNPRFSSGPCAKRPGWSPSVLEGAYLGRSHRAAGGKARLQAVIERSRRLAGLPDDWRLAIVPASDTGAMELALWNLLGPRGVDVLAWESFGKTWADDIENHLRLDDVRVLAADYGALPDLTAADFARDLVLAWNGTTSGVRLPDGDWIADDREGLVICDATSAIFAMDLPWSKLDVVTWSWQKVLGGEAAHGMLALGPRALARLQTHQPSWPLPKIFRLTKKGVLDSAVFEGATINTPSMLAVEDALDGLAWAESIGGLPALIARSEANSAAIAHWVENRDWIDYLAPRPETRSTTSVCLTIVDPKVMALSEADQRGFCKALAGQLEDAAAAYDIASYRAAPPGLRIWAGATVEQSDLEALFPWLDWAFAVVHDETL